MRGCSSSAYRARSDCATAGSASVVAGWAQDRLRALRILSGVACLLAAAASFLIGGLFILSAFGGAVGLVGWVMAACFLVLGERLFFAQRGLSTVVPILLLTIVGLGCFGYWVAMQIRAQWSGR